MSAATINDIAAKAVQAVEDIKAAERQRLKAEVEKLSTFEIPSGIYVDIDAVMLILEGATS